MHILILYDSCYGNTEQVARSMQASVEAPHRVTLARPEAFSSSLLEDIDLLVAGSPTRAFRPTKALVAALKALPSDALSRGIRSATFDTRVSLEEVDSKLLNTMVSLFGYAQQPLAKLLARKGATKPLGSAWFIVQDKEGPLKPGETERAAAWMGELLGSLMKG